MPFATITDGRNGKTKHIFGIFDLCLNRKNKSNHNEIAVIKNNIMTAEFKSPNSNFVYKHYDVCENMWLLQEVKSDLLLTERYYEVKSEPFDMRHSSVLLIITHISDDLSRLLESMSLAFGTMMPIVYTSKHNLIKTSNNNGEYFSHDSTTNGLKVMVDVMKFFGWKYIGIIFLNSTTLQTNIHRKLYNDFLTEIRKESCYVNSVVDIDNGRKSYEQLLLDIRNDPSLMVVFVFGWKKHVVS